MVPKEKHTVNELGRGVTRRILLKDGCRSQPNRKTRRSTFIHGGTRETRRKLDGSQQESRGGLTVKKKRSVRGISSEPVVLSGGLLI